ncbi:MAG: hypothetical protein Q7Q71_10675 [Verrucomicrobiota bacterium JB023]|nr:hypothetical protein [Verrucomicrobiota bacterium JB023]
MPTKQDIQDLYFMDSRAKLLDIASFLDRLDRHEGEADFRHPAFMEALRAMQNPPAGRTRTQAVLESLSDPSSEPIPAATLQGAFGAPTPAN